MSTRQVTWFDAAGNCCVDHVPGEQLSARCIALRAAGCTVSGVANDLDLGRFTMSGPITSTPVSPSPLVERTTP